MGEKSPQNREELAARFGKILGRKPTAEELAELDTDRQEHGLGYYDPVLIQLEEARDQVLKETDRRMVEQSKELMAAGMSEMKRVMEEEKKRLVELHRTSLTEAVRTSTQAAVKDQFNATWMGQWNELMKQFSKDWNEQVEPGIGRINGALQGAWKTAWVCLAVGLLLVGAMGGWWAAKWNGARVEAPAVSAPQTQPVKPSVPNRK